MTTDICFSHGKARAKAKADALFISAANVSSVNQDAF